MSQNQSNTKISALFYDHFKDFATSNTLQEAYSQLSNFMQTLLVEDDFISNQNSKIGYSNLDMPASSAIQRKKPLSEILQKVNSRKLVQKQIILATLLYQSKADPIDNDPQKALDQGLGLSENTQTPELLVYYRNEFYLIPGYLSQNINKSYTKQSETSWKINLQRNVILTSEKLRLDQYDRIVIQPQEYYKQLFPVSSFEQIKQQRKYEQFFVKNNPSLRIQTLNYSETSKAIEPMSKHYKQIAKKLLQNYKDNTKRFQEILELHSLVKTKLQYLGKNWDSKKAAFRIALVKDSPSSLHKNHDQISPTLFIYNAFQKFQFSKKDSNFQIILQKDLLFSSQNSASTDEIKLVKELLLLNMIHHKNKHQVNRIISLRQNLTTSLSQSIRQKQEDTEITRQRKIDKIKRTPAIKNFTSLSIQNFFHDWKSKISNLKQRKTPILSISLSDMYLTTEYKYTKMQCRLEVSFEKRHKNVNNQDLLEKYRFLRLPYQTSSKPIESKNIFTQIYSFTFDENSDDWNVKLSPQNPNVQSSYAEGKSGQNQHLKNICFDMSQVRDLFKIKITVTPIKSNQRNQPRNLNKIQGECYISKVQKMRMIGQDEELMLNAVDDKNSERVVGFINLFYLLKDYLDVSMAENFRLQNYRKIKYLQNVGKVPQNYFETTAVNYTPDEIPFFAQLLSTKQESITVRNFESNYVSLIEFLEGEKKNNRREQIIEAQNESNNLGNSSLKSSQKKTFKFPYYQRIQMYEKILKHQLLSNAKPSKETPEPNESYLGDRFVYYKVPSQLDQISLKTFAILSESLKFSMNRAQKLYCPQSHLQTLGVISMIFSLNSSTVQQIQVPAAKSNSSSSKTSHPNRTANNLKIIQTFNPYLVPIVNRIITLFKVQRKSLNQTQSMRSQSSISSDPIESLNHSKVTEFTINFLLQLYPYSDPKNLQKQCLYIRYFVQKYLPQLNLNLNRKHIGLENFVSKYLLSLFSLDLEEEITFTVWDFIVSCSNKSAARMNCILTLLIFMEKTNFHAVIPASNFAKALDENYIKFDFSNNSKKISDKMLECLGELYEKEHKRKEAIYGLRDQKGELLLGNEFVRKVMFDTQRANKVNYVGNKKVNLNDLSYKLPEPKYYGHPVEQIKLLLKSIFISDTVSLNDWNLVVKWHNATSDKVVITHKNQNLNHFLRFNYPKQLKENSFDLPHLEFVISPKKSHDKCFVGYLPILNLHKDHVYCEQVRLLYLKDGQIQLSNKGENILHLQLILKSKVLPQEASVTKHNSLEASKISKVSATVNNTNLRLQKQYFVNQQKRKQIVYDRLLDYELDEENNDALKEIKRLKIVFYKMKNPIDQFTHEKYQKLKVPSLGDITFPEVLMNSELLIEHLQALVDQTFADSKSLKANLPEIYKIFSKNTNYQMVFLTQILIEAILIDRKITFQQKIEYLYCLGKHYQNTCGTGLTTQTIDFIVSYIFKTYGWLTAVPYVQQGKGQIIQGIIYVKGLKVKEEGLDITSILRDWVHICKIKYGNLDLVLGDAMFLTQLRSLLPFQTLESLENSNNAKQLRIEIIYQKSQSKYMWSACVDIGDFRVKEVGTKFLERYPPQRQLHSGTVICHHPNCSKLTQLCWNEKSCRGCNSEDVELDTASEILYNCNNLISLESSCTISRAEFKNIFYTTPLICYLLHFSSVYEPVEFVSGKPLISKSPELEGEKGEGEEFKDWMLYRYENCIEKWRKCNVQNTEGEVSYVQMPDEMLKMEKQVVQMLRQKYKLNNASQALLYKAPAFEVWSMEENFVDEASTGDSQNSNDARIKNQRQAMRKISQIK